MFTLKAYSLEGILCILPDSHRRTVFSVSSWKALAYEREQPELQIAARMNGKYLLDRCVAGHYFVFSPSSPAIWLPATLSNLLSALELPLLESEEYHQKNWRPRRECLSLLYWSIVCTGHSPRLIETFAHSLSEFLHCHPSERPDDTLSSSFRATEQCVLLENLSDRSPFVWYLFRINNLENKLIEDSVQDLLRQYSWTTF